MAEHTPKPNPSQKVLAKEVLAKEVLAPQNPHSGLGVVLVASLAMFLAMASSAFVIRARMAGQSCPAHRATYQSQLPAAKQWHAVERVSPGECGKPQYRTNPDGSVSVLFETCADRARHRDAARQDAHQAGEQPVGIEVRRIH